MSKSKIMTQESAMTCKLHAVAACRDNLTKQNLPGALLPKHHGSSSSSVNTALVHQNGRRLHNADTVAGRKSEGTSLQLHIATGNDFQRSAATNFSTRGDNASRESGAKRF
jgi:prophage DNA circulation protein